MFSVCVCEGWDLDVSEGRKEEGRQDLNKNEDGSADIIDMNSTCISLANGIRFSYSAVIIFFSIQHTMTPCGTFLNYSARVHDNPAEGYCQISAAIVVHASSRMLHYATLARASQYIHGLCSQRSRPCVFLIINRKWASEMLDPVSVIHEQSLVPDFCNVLI